MLYKEYDKVITIFESIINTDYTCEEVGDPEYDDPNNIYSIYEIDINTIKDDLGIDLKSACLYAIYSVLMSNKKDKFEKIWNYVSICKNVNIKDVKNIGIEKIKNFDEFYVDWKKYLEDKK